MDVILSEHTAETNTAGHLRLLRQQTVLAKFGELALKSTNLDEILTEACALVGEALGTDLAKVMELQQDGKILLVRAGVGWLPGVIGVVTIKASDNTSQGLALRTGEPVISPDIATEIRFNYPQYLTDNGVKAMANVPIIGGYGRPILGILQIDSRVPRLFTDEDTNFLRTYANLLAAAMDRLRILEEVRDSEARLALALEVGELGSWSLDLATGKAVRSGRCCQIFGYPSVSSPWSYDIFLQHVVADDREQVDKLYCNAITNDVEWRCQCRINRADDGALRWIEVQARPVFGGGAHSNDVHLIGIMADITERMEVESRLRRSNGVLEAEVAAQIEKRNAEARFRFATQAGHLGVWELDLRTGELEASAMCKENFGSCSDLPFSYATMLAAFHHDDRSRFVEAIAEAAGTGNEFDLVCRISRPDGSDGWIQMHAQAARSDAGPPFRMAGISLDITERMRSEERILQSQRIEAVGRLTAGVAHDFNNVLQVLLGGLELSIEELQDRPAVRSDLELAFQAGQRGARLTSHLLSFSRQQVLSPTPLDLAILLSELSHTLERTLGHTIVVYIKVAPGLPLILADAAHLDSALLNLALNARDAMPHGGEIRFDAAAYPHGVVISVSDTGAGMTREVMTHACEPFFTTKGVKGSGLGLSMVQGFASQSGGELRLDSAPGKGTRVEITLPLAQTPKTLLSRSGSDHSSGAGRVLIVDDDADVARITAAFLRKAGYDVSRVGSGHAALVELAKDQSYEVLVTDYAMPGMNGADLVLEARELQPNMAALIITGYAGAEGLDRVPGDIAILRKPFQREELVLAVKTAVAGPMAKKPPRVDAAATV